jgi:hypothetical protein
MNKLKKYGKIALDALMNLNFMQIIYFIPALRPCCAGKHSLMDSRIRFNHAMFNEVSLVK